MQWLGSVAFTIFLFLWTGFYAVVFVLVGLFMPFRARFALARGWARPLLAMLRVLCGLDYRIEGAERLPPGNHVALIKHSSSWETFAQVVLVPPHVWVLKRELMWVPFLGWALWLMRAISVDRKSGKIKVHNFWAAIDPGLAVQPRNVAAQTEGSIIYGLGHVLREKITIRNGRVLESNYSDYEVTRMSDVPNIEVKVVSTDNPPTGAGEDGVPLVAAAVGNAIAALTGVRLRELPFAPERVRGALGA